MVDLSGIDHKSIIERAKAIILTPNSEWPKIATESRSDGDLFKGYILPLALIAPLASLIGGQLFGYGLLGFGYTPGLVGAITGAIVQFAVAVAATYLLSLIVDFLAPKFGGLANRSNALKLVAYGATAAWLAGIFGLIPWLAVFGLVGLYSIYLIYVGAEPMMKVPQSQAVGFTAVTLLCALVLMAIAGRVSSAVTGLFGLGGLVAAVSGSTDTGGKITVPGGGSISLDDAKKASEQMQATINGKAQPIDVNKIQALLPAEIGAYQRTATEATGLGAVGGQAMGTYIADAKRFQLKIVDMAALGAIAGIGASMGVQHSQSDADGYSRTGMVNGQMQMEAWSKSSESGKFGVMVANRFLIEADGSAANIDELKAAVATIDQGNLMSLAE